MEPRDIMDNEEIIPSEEVPQQTAEPITEILTPIEPVMQEPVSTEPAVEEETSAEPIVQEQTPVEAIVQEQIPAQPVVQAAQPVISEQPAPSAPTYQPKSTTYHGAGVGHKESPYANSPYYSPYNPQPSGSGTYIPPQQTPPPVKKQPKVKKRRKLSPRGKSILAAVLAVVILVVSCAATASVVNGRWEKKLDALQQQMDDQFAHLQQQIEQVNTSGGGMIGIPVESGALTPGQVYAKNVYSVVGISNYAEFSSGWGESTTQLAGTGSGFIISEDGYAITNYHVVEGASYLTVTTYTGEEYEATLVGHDQLNDVALLKVDASGLTPVEIGSSDELVIGDMVVAIGNPLGELTATQTVGYISGKDRSVSTDGAVINMLQTDAAINSGNSGGPMFNMKGQVVGITTAKYSGPSSSGASIEGIGFAIPIDDVMGMIADLREYGYLKNQAYLGVTVRDMDPSTASIYSLPTGSYVDSVVEGGSAHRAGVQPKDIIIAVGDIKVTGNSELTSALRKFSAGDTSTITVFRAGQEIVLSITFDEKPQNVEVQPTDPTVPGEMPNSGNYNEWYEYFAPFFGG